MPAPTTTAELLELVARSGLTDEARLRALVEHLTESGSLPADPRAFATELIRNGCTSCFQAKQLLLGRWTGFDIGQYRLLEFIGTNTTCAFYLCECPRTQRVVVLEVLPPALADIPSTLDRFHREARAMARCCHPNIVSVHEVNQD